MRAELDESFMEFMHDVDSACEKYGKDGMTNERLDDIEAKISSAIDAVLENEPPEYIVSSLTVCKAYIINKLRSLKQRGEGL